MDNLIALIEKAENAIGKTNETAVLNELTAFLDELPELMEIVGID